jgi:hypothetical protein
LCTPSVSDALQIEDCTFNLQDSAVIARHAQATARRLATGFPILLITGPRQSGKTTLARALFADRPYVSLEDPEQREFALSDPKGFLGRFGEGAVIEEVQHVPALLSYLQGLVDARARMVDFVLTGSQQFGLMSGVSQSLAGRTGRIERWLRLAGAQALPPLLVYGGVEGYRRGGVEVIPWRCAGRSAD